MIGESVIGELTIAGDVVATPPTPPIVIAPGSVAIYVTKAASRKYVTAHRAVYHPTRSVRTNYVQKVKRG